MISTGDLRCALFKEIMGLRVNFRVTACSPGVFAGTPRLAARARDIGVDVRHLAGEGEVLHEGTVVVEAAGNPLQVALAEETFIGLIAKPSGVATAARRAVAEILRQRLGQIRGQLLRRERALGR
ncbi:MAG: hypothetical protein NUV93_09690, partial [Firmicutes bacterium]|nr:hypothetical protein [Bacillota bacterium]